MPSDCETWFVIYYFGGFMSGILAAFLVGLGLTTKAEEQNGKVRERANRR